MGAANKIHVVFNDIESADCRALSQQGLAGYAAAAEYNPKVIVPNHLFEVETVPNGDSPRSQEIDPFRAGTHPGVGLWLLYTWNRSHTEVRERPGNLERILRGSRARPPTPTARIIPLDRSS